MKDGPNIARIAVAIGDRARADMLSALLGGQALTATELATQADITKQTASTHLSKLLDAGLVTVLTQGRHRYFQLAAPDVARLLENLTGVAERTGAVRVRTGPREPALRRARVCYDHLAGELGVALFDALVRRKLIELPASHGTEGGLIELTDKGRRFFDGLGIDLDASGRSRRAPCRSCLDWSVRRHHLAGTLGAAVLDRCYEQKWAKRINGTRIVRFSRAGESNFRKTFGLRPAN